MNPEVEKLGYLILVYYIGSGLFLGIITLMDEGIELALGFHFANNFPSYTNLSKMYNTNIPNEICIKIFAIYTSL